MSGRQACTVAAGVSTAAQRGETASRRDRQGETEVWSRGAANRHSRSHRSNEERERSG